MTLSLTIPDAPADTLALSLARAGVPRHPNAIGRWLSAQLDAGSFNRLNMSDRQDLRTAAFILESWAAPKRRKWWRVWA